MHDVASATPDALTLRHMASERALPRAQNDALRRRLRDLIRRGADRYPAWTLTAALSSMLPR